MSALLHAAILSPPRPEFPPNQRIQFQTPRIPPECALVACRKAAIRGRGKTIAHIAARRLSLPPVHSPSAGLCPAAGQSPRLFMFLYLPINIWRKDNCPIRGIIWQDLGALKRPPLLGCSRRPGSRCSAGNAAARPPHSRRLSGPKAECPSSTSPDSIPHGGAGNAFFRPPVVRIRAPLGRAARVILWRYISAITSGQARTPRQARHAPARQHTTLHRPPC